MKECKMQSKALKENFVSYNYLIPTFRHQKIKKVDFFTFQVWNIEDKKKREEEKKRRGEEQERRGEEQERREEENER